MDSGANPLHPNHMTAAERIAELAEILARGLIRLRARKSSPLSSDRGDNFVDCTATQSGHGPVAEPTETMP